MRSKVDPGPGSTAVSLEKNATFLLHLLKECLRFDFGVNCRQRFTDRLGRMCSLTPDGYRASAATLLETIPPTDIMPSLELPPEFER